MLNRSCNIHIMKCRFSAASLSLIFLERRSYFFLLLDIFVHQFDSKIVFRVYDNSRFPKEVFLASIIQIHPLVIVFLNLVYDIPSCYYKVNEDNLPKTAQVYSYYI